MVRVGPSGGVSGTDGNGGDGQSLLQVARRVAATIGRDFFHAMTKHLAKALGADCVLIGEFVGGHVERVRTLAASMDGLPATFEYELAGTASAQLALGKPCLVRSDAQTKFPSDTLLSRTGAQSCVGVPLADPAGQPLGLMLALYRRPMGSFREQKAMLDIFSERAAAELNRTREEERLRESEQRYRAFIARSADAMWRVEFEQPIPTDLPELTQLERMYQYGYVAECNDALARLVGRETGSQLIGSRLEEVAPQSDASMREANLLAIRSGFEFTTVEVRRTNHSGTRQHLLRSQWGIVEEGGLVRVWGTTRDVTELKHSEQALDASEQRMADLLETVQLVVVILGPEGTVVFCNKYFYRLLGWQTSDVVGKDWFERMVPEEERGKLRALFADGVKHTGIPMHFESALLGPDGRRWQFEWDSTTLRDAEGRVAAWANVGRDVTDFKEMEAQFRQSQKLATMGKLAGGVAHDFNNLLTVILGYSSSLLEKRTPADPAYGPLREVRDAAGKGAELTHRLLAFSRRQVWRPEVLSLNAVIADAERMLRRLIGEDIHLTTNLDPALGFVRADSGHLHQVLMNLVINARDAMPGGGIVIIGASNVEIKPNSPVAATVGPGEYVELSVSDTGMGMSEETRSHLFEPFFTTKEYGKGTGLGLSTVYGIVQQSGGRIMVDTKLGKGTTFRILLPRVAAESAPDLAPGATVDTLRGTETILLVEDQDEVRRLTAKILTDLGYTVLEAESPVRALELAQDRGRTIHLLLTDVVMPGTAGFELANQVKTYQAGIKVLFMSGYADESSFAEKVSEPGFVYLQKPFTPELLGTKVRESLVQP